MRKASTGRRATVRVRHLTHPACSGTDSGGSGPWAGSNRADEPTTGRGTVDDRAGVGVVASCTVFARDPGPPCRRRRPARCAQFGVPFWANEACPRWARVAMSTSERSRSHRLRQRSRRRGEPGRQRHPLIPPAPCSACGLGASGYAVPPELRELERRAVREDARGPRRCREIGPVVLTLTSASRSRTHPCFARSQPQQTIGFAGSGSARSSSWRYAMIPAKVHDLRTRASGRGGQRHEAGPQPECEWGSNPGRIAFRCRCRRR